MYKYTHGFVLFVLCKCGTCDPCCTSALNGFPTFLFLALQKQRGTREQLAINEKLQKSKKKKALRLLLLLCYVTVQPIVERIHRKCLLERKRANQQH